MKLLFLFTFFSALAFSQLDLHEKNLKINDLDGDNRFTYQNEIEISEPNPGKLGLSWDLKKSKDKKKHSEYLYTGEVKSGGVENKATQFTRVEKAGNHVANVYQAYLQRNSNGKYRQREHLLRYDNGKLVSVLNCVLHKDQSGKVDSKAKFNSSRVDSSKCRHYTPLFCQSLVSSFNQNSVLAKQCSTLQTSMKKVYDNSKTDFVQDMKYLQKKGQEHLIPNLKKKYFRPFYQAGAKTTNLFKKIIGKSSSKSKSGEYNSSAYNVNVDPSFKDVANDYALCNHLRTNLDFKVEGIDNTLNFNFNDGAEQ